MPKTKPTFGARLLDLRSSASLTQAELAKAAGTTQQAVALWERGLRRPGWDQVIRLAAALGVSTEDFSGHVPGAD